MMPSSFKEGSSGSACTYMLSAVVMLLSILASQGQMTNSVCGNCCQGGSYCGSTTAPTTISIAAGGLAAGTVIPKGTDLTCYTRTRDVPGAVDGGLCIPPQGVPDITTLCATLANSELFKVDTTIYQAGLTDQTEVCKPCCEGTSICGSGLKCAKVASPTDYKGGVCVPDSDPTNTALCGPTLTLSQATISCERCDAFTDAAQFIADQTLSSSMNGGPMSG